MSGWPWPLDGVQSWFEGLWNWISQAAVSAVSVVSEWITNAIATISNNISGLVNTLWANISGAFGSLWTQITGAITNLWNSISSSVSGLWTSISDAFSTAWAGISNAFSDIWTNIVGAVSGLWDSISNGLSGLWGSISAGLGAIGESVASDLGNLWSGFVSFMGDVVNGLGEGINAVGSAVGSAVGTIGGWVTDALSGVAQALGGALMGFFNWVWSGLPTIAGAIVGFVSEHIITPLMGALNWIRDAIFNILRGMWESVRSLFGSHSPITPEEAVGFTTPLLLIGAGAGFGVSAMGAMASLKVLGSGVEARAVTDFMESAFALGEISRSVIMPIFAAAYSTPIRYYYNSVYRPAIPSTGQADQMLFEGNITKDQWHQIYAYNGWKEADINAWHKTMFREPNQRTLLTMLEDPEIGESWILKKLSELGLGSEDRDVLVGYKRRLLENKRLAKYDSLKNKLRDNSIADFVKGYLVEDVLRANLAVLDFSPEEIDYFVADAKADRERKQNDALLDIYDDAYQKEQLNDEQLAARGAEIIKDPAALSIYLDKAYIRKYKKPKGEVGG